jgi:hypothetical protein
VLTQRTDHIDAIVDGLTDLGDTPLVLRGGLGKRARQAVTDALAAREPDDGLVLVATGSYLGEGFDWPDLDTLFLAFPLALCSTTTSTATSPSWTACTPNGSPPTPPSASTSPPAGTEPTDPAHPQPTNPTRSDHEPAADPGAMAPKRPTSAGFDAPRRVRRSSTAPHPKVAIEGVVGWLPRRMIASTTELSASSTRSGATRGAPT